MSPEEFQKQMKAIADAQADLDMHGDQDPVQQAAIRSEAVTLAVEALRSAGFGDGATIFVGIMKVYA